VLLRELRRGRAESPGGGRERAARGRLSPRLDLGAVLGRHRQTAALRVEDERPRAEPAPAAGRLRREPDGDAAGRLVLRGDGDHRLRERHAQLRRERHLALRRVAQHAARPRRPGVGHGPLLGGRERGQHGRARARGRLRALAQRELPRALRLGLERREPLQDPLGLRLREPRGGRGRRPRAGPGRARLRPFAQAEAQPLRPRHGLRFFVLRQHASSHGARAGGRRGRRQRARS
jgi:hypothetical protein